MRGKATSAVGWLVVTLMSIAALADAATDAGLAEAVRHRDAKAVAALLEQGVDVNAPLEYGTTALHWAVHLDDGTTVGLLLAAGARVNAVDRQGVTPLWLACTNRNVQIVEQLLKAGANPQVALSGGGTVLMRAAQTGHAEVVSLLLAHGADVNATEHERGQTALMWAAAEGRAEAARVLIQHGADVHARSTTGYSPLLLAARSADTAEVLLDAGAEVNAAAADGTTALVVSIIRGNTALANLLLERGADPNAGPGFAPLHWVVGAWGAGETLNNNRRDENSDWLMFEGLKGAAKLEMAQALLAHGANPNARAQRRPGYQGSRLGVVGRAYGANVYAGATPLVIAAQDADLDIMRLLAAHGADASLATERKVTPLMAAAGVGAGISSTPVPQSRAVEAIKLCLELGNDVNAANVDGNAALHGAAYRGTQGTELVIQVLVDNGANINARNQWGWTPLTIVEGLYFNGANTLDPNGVALLRNLGTEPSPSDLNRVVGSAIANGRVNQ